MVKKEVCSYGCESGNAASYYDDIECHDDCLTAITLNKKE